MDPRLFGQGTWLLIFHFIYFFITDFDLIRSIRMKTINNSLGMNNDDKKKLYEEINKDLEQLSTSKILLKKTARINNAENLENFFNDLTTDIMDLFKKHLYNIFDGLACSVCREHSLNDSMKNEIFKSDDIYKYLIFLIDLRNDFYEDNRKIDRNLFKTEKDFIRNKALLFKALL